MLLGWLNAILRFLREAAGENDYERYRLRTLARGGVPLAPAAYYVDRLNLKYSRPNRCC